MKHMNNVNIVSNSLSLLVIDSIPYSSKKQRTKGCPVLLCCETLMDACSKDSS